jgi:hypothetical protein
MYVINRITGISSGTKLRGTDINGISAMINSSNATFYILGRSQ